VQIGRLGRLRLAPGFYVYVGSAGGPGGVAARLAYHRRPPRRPHWHVDYLKAAARLVDIWYATGRTCREHEWARRLARAPGALTPLPGFGASDCTCAAHLLYFAERPSPAVLGRRHRTLTTLAVAGEPPVG
jgi:Uri superfamily endonuclease